MLRGQLETIPGGSAGLQAKIRTIRALVADAVRDADFRQMAVEQLRGVRARDWSGEISAVRRFVMRMRFTRDPYTADGLEVFVHPKVMMLQILGGNAFGDCDDHVLLATAMLEVIGHPTRYRVGGTRRGVYQHIWLDVQHPTRGWVPVELIKPGVKVGWDPSQKFAHVESHPSEATTMQGLGSITVTTEPRAGGGVSRQVIHRGRGFGQPLPSDIVRVIKSRERRAGVTVEEMTNMPHEAPASGGLGWVSAAINAAVAVGSAYHGYAQNKRERRRAMREKSALRAEGMTATEADYVVGRPPPVDYSRYVGQLARSGQSLYNEFSYENPYTDDYFRAQEVESTPGFVGPRRALPANYDPIAEAQARVYFERGGVQPTRDWDREFNLATRGGGGGTRKRISRGASLLDDARKFDYGRAWSAILERGGDLTESQRAGLLQYLETESAGFQGLGEDPTDPGPYVPLTKPLKMPDGWVELINAWVPKNRWDTQWYIDLLPKIAADAAAQGATSYKSLTLTQGFDIAKYPGGTDGWRKHWSNLSMLGNPLIERWAYFFALTHHPRFLKSVHSGWLATLKWVLKEIDKTAKTLWLKDEAVRKVEHLAKLETWNTWKGKKDAEDRRKNAAEEAKRRADEAKRAADEQRRREEDARRAADRAKRAQENLDLSRRTGSRGGSGGAKSRVPPVYGPPPAPPAKDNTLLYAGAAAALIFFMRKK